MRICIALGYNSGCAKTKIYEIVNTQYVFVTLFWTAVPAKLHYGSRTMILFGKNSQISGVFAEVFASALEETILANAVRSVG